MYAYHYVFLVLKVIILVQFALIFFNKESIDADIYIVTEVVFKTALGIFIEILMFHRPIEGLAFEDRVVLSFAGGLLMYDAWFNDFPQLLAKYNKKIVLYPVPWIAPL
jgi:hypothetical protein